MLLLLISLAPQTATVAQEQIAVSSPADDAAVTVAQDPLETIKQIFAGRRAPASLPDLQAMQQHQQALARKVIPCTVCIRVGVAQGSGVLINRDGYVLTAAHVAQTPDQPAKIILHDGRVVNGTTLGMDRSIDAGLVKIDDPPSQGTEWPFVEMGTSDRVRAGQWCAVTGHPGGFQTGRDPVFRVGRVLARDTKVIVTDCPLIGGDSGGPLFDMDGRVIGVNSRIGPQLTQNMHVPVNAYSQQWESLARGDIWGDVQRGNPYIGVYSEDSPGGGAVLKTVRAGQPAAKAGLRDGDVVLKFGGQEIQSAQDLVKRVASSRAGQTVKLTIQRAEETKEVSLVIGRKRR